MRILLTYILNFLLQEVLESQAAGRCGNCEVGALLKPMSPREQFAGNCFGSPDCLAQPVSREQEGVGDTTLPRVKDTCSLLPTKLPASYQVGIWN